jgi:hypothetical protein
MAESETEQTIDEQPPATSPQGDGAGEEQPTDDDTEATH